MVKDLSEGMILGLGNPLLDVCAMVNEELLAKYDLKPNNAILAEEKHENLCREMADQFKVDFIAGGAIQNTMRVAQWFFSTPQVCTFFGAIGDDDFGRQMSSKANEDRVRTVYMIDPAVPTGTCACLITDQGKARSLCAYLGASQKFVADHLKRNMDWVEKSRIIYTSGFHLIVSLEASLLLAEHAHNSPDKVFAFNLSAPYISQFYSKQLLAIMPYTDLLFGNETEAQAFAEMQGWKTSNMEEIVQKLADFEHRRPRTVVITQGKDPILVSFTGKPDSLRRFPVPTLPDDQIVDTNGAGDSFVGGFLAYYLLERPLEECIKAGIFAAVEIIKMSGCAFPPQNPMRV